MAMIPGIIGVVGASAVTEIRRRAARQNETKFLKEELVNAKKQLEEQAELTDEVASKCTVLEQVNQALEERNKDLEVKTNILEHDLESTTSSVAKMQENVQEVSAACTQLNKNTGRLLEQNKNLQNTLQQKEKEVKDYTSKVNEQARLLEEMATEKQQLLEALESERKFRAAERESFIMEKEKLLLQMEHVEEERQQDKLALEEERRKLTAEMDKLRSSVSRLMDKFLSEDMNEKDLVAQLNGLGCEVKLIEDKDGTTRVNVVDAKHQPGRQSSSGTEDWLFQPRLVMDCPERIQRLVAASMAQQQSRPMLRASATMPPLRALQPTDLNKLPSRTEATAFKAVPKLADGSDEPRSLSPPAAPAPAPTPALKPSYNIQVTNGHVEPQLSAKPQAEPQAESSFQWLRRATSGLSFKHNSPPSARPPLTAAISSLSSTSSMDSDSGLELGASTDIIKARD